MGGTLIEKRSDRRFMEPRQKSKSDVEIDILPILKELLSKLWLMVLVGVVLAGMVFAATKILIKPTYRCNFTAYVNNQHAQLNKDSLTSSDLNAAKQLVETYVRIVRSNRILTAAAESISLDLPYSKLQQMVTADVQGETEIIAVHVESKDPQQAYDLAEAIATVAPTYMSDIVEGSSMKIIDSPVYNTNRYKPSYIKYSLFGFLAGILIVAIIVIIRFLRDDTIRSEGELEQRFGLSILGVLPDYASNGSKYGYYSYEYGYGKKQNDEEKEGDKNEQKGKDK